MTKTETQKSDADVRELYQQIQADYHKEQAEKLIRDAAAMLVRLSKDVERYADQIHDGSLTPQQALSWSLNHLASIQPNLRLDLFVDYAVNATAFAE